jgi:hypothetical protein
MLTKAELRVTVLVAYAIFYIFNTTGVALGIPWGVRIVDGNDIESKALGGPSRQ